MSRRHTSNRDPRPFSRVVAAALVLLVALAAALPASALAQGTKIRNQDVEWAWQLLEYREAIGDTELEPVPAGVGATVRLFSESASGEAACSTYDSHYTRSRESLFIDPPEIQRFDCDAASQAFDDAFYRNLSDTASIAVTDSILTLLDLVGEPLMTLTRAVIDDDPTVARWDLARIGTAEGSIEPVIQGLDPWVEFLRGGRLVGSSGCGSFLGSYTVNDSTMALSDVAYRLETCIDGARRQAEQIIGTFGDVTDFEVLPAGLTLKDEVGATRLALTPAIDLGQRTWTPVEILDDENEVAFGADRLNTSAVKFHAGVVEGASICRSFTGTSLIAGLAVNVTGIEFDLADKPCPKPKKKDVVPQRAVEAAFIDALEQASSHALRGSELELKDVNGNTLMRLLPQAELVGPTWFVTHLNLTPNAAKPKRRVPVEGTTLNATFEDIDVVLGDTGAADRRGTNVFVASYRTPAASKIRIWDATIDGFACDGAKARKPECRQQARYLALLQSADGYIVREGELRLLKSTPQGRQPLIWFGPEPVSTTE